MGPGLVGCMVGRVEGLQGRALSPSDSVSETKDAKLTMPSTAILGVNSFDVWPSPRALRCPLVLRDSCSVRHWEPVPLPVPMPSPRAALSDLPSDYFLE